MTARAAEGVVRLTTEELLTVLAALGHLQRLRIIGELAQRRVHVSELARRLQLSRPLLYMHLDRLEKAGLVVGHLELAEDGKAMKYFELVPLDLRLTTSTILDALRSDQTRSADVEGATTSDTHKENPT